MRLPFQLPPQMLNEEVYCGRKGCRIQYQMPPQKRWKEELLGNFLPQAGAVQVPCVLLMVVQSWDH